MWRARNFACRSGVHAAERARAVASGLGSGFALNQLNGGIVGVAELAQSTDPLEHTGFVGVVCMISDGVDDLGCSGGKYVVDPLIAGQAGGAADDFCIGIAGPDRGCSRLDEFSIFRSADSVLPAPSAVRLVPDFIPLDFSAVAGGECGDIIVPRLFLLSGMDRGAADCTENLGGAGVIKPVSVTETDPRLQTAPEQIVDDAVDPLPVIDSLFSLRPCPAGLDADPFDTELCDLVIRLFRIEHPAVEFFKSESDRRLPDLIGGNSFHCSDTFQIIHRCISLCNLWLYHQCTAVSCDGKLFLCQNL